MLCLKFRVLRRSDGRVAGEKLLKRMLALVNRKPEDSSGGNRLSQQYQMNTENSGVYTGGWKSFRKLAGLLSGTDQNAALH